MTKYFKYKQYQERFIILIYKPLIYKQTENQLIAWSKHSCLLNLVLHTFQSYTIRRHTLIVFIRQPTLI